LRAAPGGKSRYVATPGFDIRESRTDEELCIEVHGDLDVLTAPRLVERFEAALLARPPRIVLELRDVAFADSTGMAALIRCRRRAVRADVDLVLDVAAGPVARLLDITRLRRVFATR